MVKFCSECGTKLKKGSTICPKCQHDCAEKKAPKVNSSKDDDKIYKILAYLGILWVIGMLVDSKDHKDVKFHVGQGLLLFVAEILIGIVVAIIQALIKIAFTTTTTQIISGFPIQTSQTSVIGNILNILISLGSFAIIVYFIYTGIHNVIKNKQEPLPVIGKYVFYK